MIKNKFAIIGAGISSLSVARLLLERHVNPVLFDNAEKPGGLIKCDQVQNILYHRVGGHVFNSKNQTVLDWFWQHFDQEAEFLVTKRNAKIWLQGNYVGYPLENHLYQLDEKTISTVIDELMKLSKSPQLSPFDYENFESFLKGNFGEKLYELYFRPYNEKIWGVDLSTVSLHWLEGKLPMPNYRDTILSNILQKGEEKMVHSSFYYPVKGGSQFIANRLAEGLNIQYSSQVQSLSYNDGYWYVNGSGPYGSLIYTGDVRNLIDIIEIEDDNVTQACQAVTDLQSHGTSNLLCETDDSDLSWLYLPENTTSAHRIIYTGNFSPNNNAAFGRLTCTVEFSGKKTYEEMLKTLPLLPGNLEAVDWNYEPNSYVIQSHDTRVKIASLKDVLAPYNFHLLGRFAEWEYYNMDKAIEAAMSLCTQVTT